jgi:hypothetical protein
MIVLGRKARKLNGSDYRFGAHHPHCKRHKNHLIWIFGHPLCLGCTCMYSGLFLGSLLALTINWSSFSFFEWVILHLVLLVPTGLQPWVQKKFFKVVARLLLGISLGSYLLSGLFLYRGIFDFCIFKILVLIALFIGYKILISLRRLKPNDPCKSCPLGVYPTCEWNLPRLLANNDDPLLREALIVRGAESTTPDRIMEP